MDNLVGYSPKDVTCRRCGKTFEVNFYDKDMDHHMYCSDCLREQEKKNKSRVFIQRDLLYPLLQGLDIPGKEAVKIYKSLKEEFDYLNRKINKYKAYFEILKGIIDE